MKKKPASKTETIVPKAVSYELHKDGAVLTTCTSETKKRAEEFFTSYVERHFDEKDLKGYEIKEK